MLLAAQAQAQGIDEAPRDPSRFLLLGSAGVPLRLTVDEDFGQDRVGVTFFDVMVGYALPGASAKYRHGLGIGLSWNLGHDGGYTAPIYTGDQIVLMPAYLGYMPLSRDVLLLGHLGVPLVLSGGAGPGLEVGAALGYHLFAGAGVFAEVDLAGYAVGEASPSLIVSAEAGVFVNYEALP